MRTAILGFAQTGKTALFRILCGPRAHAEAYGTHLGVARVPDPRLEALAELYHPKKTTFATLEFLDSPSLVCEPEKDAAVFGQVRAADAFVHAVRLFGEDVDPARDVARLETEFLVNDLDTVSKRLDKVTRDLKKGAGDVMEAERAALEKCRAALAAEKPVRELEFGGEEQKLLRGFMLLSAKPLLVVLNAAENFAPELDHLPEKFNLAGLARRPGLALAGMCGALESELTELDPGEAAAFLESYGLRASSRTRVLHALYSLMGTITFFTVSEAECRAWTAPRGTVALEAAGMVHSDFARRFIRAEVIPWQELVDAGGLAAAREQARLRLEGKEYSVADGDVLYIRHTA